MSNSALGVRPIHEAGSSLGVEDAVSSGISSSAVQRIGAPVADTRSPKGMPPHGEYPSNANVGD